MTEVGRTTDREVVLDGLGSPKAIERGRPLRERDAREREEGQQ
jgi:hypothetical protein